MEHQRIRLIKWSVFVGLLLLVLWVVFGVDNLLVSFLLAIVFTYLLDPLVNYFERLKLNRLWATVLTFVIGIIVLTVLITFIAPIIFLQLSHFRLELPKYLQATSEMLVDVEDRMTQALGGDRQLKLSEKLEESITSWSASIFGNVAMFLTDLLKTLLLAPFFTFFFLKDGHHLSRKLLNFVPDHYFEFISQLHRQISQQTGSFIRARIFEAIIVGFIVWCGLLVLDFPFATLLAFFAMLTNLVPYIGPLIGVVPAIIVSITNGHNFVELLLMGGVYGLAQLVDNLLIIPVFLARVMDLHPVTVVISIIAGAQFMGIVGMLISIPIVNILKLVAMNFYHHFTQSS